MIADTNKKFFGIFGMGMCAGVVVLGALFISFHECRGDEVHRLKDEVAHLKTVNMGLKSMLCQPGSGWGWIDGPPTGAVSPPLTDD